MLLFMVQFHLAGTLLRPRSMGSEDPDLINDPHQEITEVYCVLIFFGIFKAEKRTIDHREIL